MTKEEKKARKKLAKDVATELRRRAKAAGWQAVQGWLFRDDEGWFVDAWCSVWPMQMKTTVTVHIKPMGIDPVFWDIVQMPENIKQPLSFRLLGAWTVNTPERGQREIEDTGLDAGTLADSILSTASLELARTREHRSIESFVDFAKERRPGAPSHPHLTAVVCAHIMRGDPDAAMSELRAAHADGSIGGYLVGSKSFVDLAIEWIGKNAPTRH
jgi:hypothetical protein